ncbi:MAG: alpha/beta fold hydrolase [Candidatus Endonucleobacter bathymodioli]|uniref:Alpha/beta fold hydrolase n=1 Tax=Candidatus Endonucleibacter bathymodioli TaxID=539814 RepID=A0AA90NVS6_9GAMM|nr:alpha/beta fold hydrolase [Candidatus Endonucleobacter bathymodioli]
MKLYANHWGQGRDVISLHGLFGSQQNLGTLNRNLAKQFRVHGLDVRNHGRSPHSDDMNYKLMAKDVIEYFDDHELHNVDLLGHSMGGKIAMTIALIVPERIRKLVVMDIAPVEYDHKCDDVLDGLSSIDLGAIKKRSDADSMLALFVKDSDVRLFLLKNLYRDKNENYQWLFNLNSIQKHYCEIVKTPPTDKVFEGDTLFLKGEDSDYILPEHEGVVLSLFPNATVKVVPGAGHWLHAQQPDLVAHSINSFLKS